VTGRQLTAAEYDHAAAVLEIAAEIDTIAAAASRREVSGPGFRLLTGDADAERIAAVWMRGEAARLRAAEGRP
jgi:hypothetical protein